MKFKPGILTLTITSPFCVIAPTMCLTSCSQYVQAKEIAKYIFETNTYTSFDMNAVNKYYGNSSNTLAGGCSAITKVIDGHRIVGRNLDLNITNKCAYIVKTAIPDKHPTLGLAYTYRNISDDYGIVKTKGINPTFSKILPFLCEDILNDQGLHVEINLRDKECWPNGDDKFVSTKTNDDPNAPRVYIYELTQLITLNCKTVDEAKNYVASLNIFSHEMEDNYCFLISDQNKSSLLEIAQNKIIWIDEDKISDIDYLKTTEFKDERPMAEKALPVNALGQTNFYMHKDFYDIQDYQMGLGRFDVLQSNISNVKSKSEMFSLMKRNDYSKVFDPDKWEEGFDPRSEAVGQLGFLTKDYLMSRTKSECRYIFEHVLPDWRHMTREEKIKDGTACESTFCEVVDVTDKTFNCRFFENDDAVYRITFDKIEKITQI